MTGVPAEVQLLAAALLLYLYDASVLLHADEGLLIAGRLDRWTVIFQPNTIVLRGRLLLVPQPLLPHRPVFRLAWRSDAATFGEADAVAEATSARAKYAPFVPFVYVAAVLLFGILPIGLFYVGADVFLLGVAALLYLNSLVAGIMLVRQREALGIDRRRAWACACECVLCPPFAVNLVRRLSLAERWTCSLPLAGAELLAPADWERLKHKLLAVQDEEIEDAASEEARAALVGARAALLDAKGRHVDD